MLSFVGVVCLLMTQNSVAQTPLNLTLVNAGAVFSYNTTTKIIYNNNAAACWGTYYAYSNALSSPDFIFSFTIGAGTNLQTTGGTHYVSADIGVHSTQTGVPANGSMRKLYNYYFYLNHYKATTGAASTYVQIREADVTRQTITGIAIGDVFAIKKVGTVVTYYKNGNLLYTSTVPATGSTYYGQYHFCNNNPLYLSNMTTLALPNAGTFAAVSSCIDVKSSITPIHNNNHNASNTQRYVLCNAQGIIMQVSTTPSFSTYGVGGFTVYAVNYPTNGVTNLNVGTFITALAGSPTSYATTPLNISVCKTNCGIFTSLIKQ